MKKPKTTVCNHCNQDCAPENFPVFRGDRSRTCRPCLNTKARKVRASRRGLPLEITEKTCLHCKQTLPVNNFYRATQNKDGVSGLCKTCAGLKTRRSKIKITYGVSADFIAARWWLQEGRCAICDQPFGSGNFRKNDVRTPYIDHEHATDKVRGLLCMRCNIAVGMMKDSPILLRQAQTYLESNV